jgi:acetoin utilization deacetylase AcuC-like enzyme
MTTTVCVTHPDYRLHTLDGHPENASRIERIWQVLEKSNALDDLLLIEPEPAPLDQLALIHDQRYITHVKKASEQGGGRLDPDTYALPISYHVARLSAGGATAAVDAVLNGTADNALAVVRPPGHHATPFRAMGFCLFNNAAIAARYAQQSSNAIERVMIVDYDVHHGNGTQDAFYDDPTVLYASTHQYPYYPGTGALEEIGTGGARGTTLNMPVSAGTGSDGYRLLYQQVLWPVARRFKPDLILVSAGFDAHWSDPLAMMQLDLPGYAGLTHDLIEMAGELCQGRIIFVLEGGYDLEVLANGVLNVVHALRGRDEIVDPVGPLDMPGRGTEHLVEQLRILHQL